WPEAVDDIAFIQRSVKTPIASGERLVGLHLFCEMCEKHAVSVLQPDLTHCGGFTEARRIAALTEAYRIAIAPHNPQGPVSTAASIEFGFATPSYVICESVHNDVPWREDVFSGGLEIEKKGRIVRPQMKPGLGIEINEKEVKKYPFQQEVLRRSFYKDGCVGDW
ncbi:MAG TPA: enolase C-terminal domain-like protein, partial [Ginsengibacter sp.]|nr:enolase C-terminal domain-like protein [Ginsengibacter sp.]